MKMNCNLELKMTVQEFVNIDKDLQTSQLRFLFKDDIFMTTN
jgi:hypothetical protein